MSTVLLASGARSLKAVYEGGAGYAPSASGIVTETVTAVSATGFAPPVNYTVGYEPEGVAIADFNNDGRPDFVTASYSGASLSLLMATVGGTFQATQLFLPTSTQPVSVAVGDLNGDGKTDIVTLQNPYGTNGAVGVLLGNGDGTFQTMVTRASLSSYSYAVAVGDFNGDGKTDVAVTTSNGLNIALGNGDGTFQTPVLYSIGSGPESLIVGDFNGDGKPDIATANYFSNSLSILLGNGDGTFRTATTVSAYEPWSVISGDFNGDGKPDLAFTNAYAQTIGVMLGNGDGTFQSAVTYPAGGYFSVVTGDFNGDGKLDLASTNYEAGSGVSVLLGNGDGTFQAQQSYVAGSYPYALAASDFNGDGRTDLAVTNYYGSNVSFFTARFPRSPWLRRRRPQALTVGSSGAFTLSVTAAVPRHLRQSVR